MEAIFHASGMQPVTKDTLNKEVKGAGGGRWPWEGRNRVYCCSWQRGVSATRYFLPDQKILFLAEVIGFWNLENMGNYSTRANFKRDFQKMDFFGI